MHIKIHVVIDLDYLLSLLNVICQPQHKFFSIKFLELLDKLESDTHLFKIIFIFF